MPEAWVDGYQIVLGKRAPYFAGGRVRPGAVITSEMELARVTPSLENVPSEARVSVNMTLADLLGKLAEQPFEARVLFRVTSSTETLWPFVIVDDALRFDVLRAQLECEWLWVSWDDSMRVDCIVTLKRWDDD